MLIVDIDFMNLGHMPEVMEIENESFSSPWTRDMYEYDLFKREMDRCYIVAQYRDKVVGYAGLAYEFRNAHILTIAVKNKYRQLGIGEQLLIALIEFAYQRGSKKIYLEVRVSNQAAQNMYLKNNFAIEGVIAEYYQNDNEDAFLMVKKL